MRVCARVLETKHFKILTDDVDDDDDDDDFFFAIMIVTHMY